MMRRALVILAFLGTLSAGAIHAAAGVASINAGDLREWLTYIASDELAGRAVFTD